jgi:hypothetical protein
MPQTMCSNLNVVHEFQTVLETFAYNSQSTDTELQAVYITTMHQVLRLFISHYTSVDRTFDGH